MHRLLVTFAIPGVFLMSSSIILHLTGQIAAAGPINIVKKRQLGTAYGKLTKTTFLTLPISDLRLGWTFE